MVKDNVEEEFRKIREKMKKGNALNLNPDGSLSTDKMEKNFPNFELFKAVQNGDELLLCWLDTSSHHTITGGEL